MLALRVELENGAGTKIRTRDLLITNQLLYQLSYTGISGLRSRILNQSTAWRTALFDQHAAEYQPGVVDVLEIEQGHDSVGRAAGDDQQGRLVHLQGDVAEELV